MSNSEPIHFAIHDLNPWGGQDRSTLEIAKRVSRSIPVNMYCFSFAGIDESDWGEFKLFKISPNFRRPVLIKYNLYYAMTLFRFLNRSGLVHSTGTSSLLSDIVQVQFVHHAWESREEAQRHNKSLLRLCYHWVLTKYKLALEKKIYTKKKTYIAIAQTVKDELIEHFGIPEENIQVAHHGVDVDHFHPHSQSEEGQKVRSEIRAELGYSEDDFVFVLVGAVNERKGVADSLKAMALLPEEHRSRARFLVLGAGDVKPYAALSKELGVEAQFKVVSHKKDVRPYYWASDAFLLPSHYEPFGLVILEAMSCGLPTIVSACSGGAELIVNNESGVLIQDSKDETEISRHMASVMSNSEKANELANQARKVALSHTWDHVAEKYLEVFKTFRSKR